MSETIIFEEIFKSPFERNTPEEAQVVLEAIRSAHPATHGWVERWASIEPIKHPNGTTTYRAVRSHYKVG